MNVFNRVLVVIEILLLIVLLITSMVMIRPMLTNASATLEQLTYLFESRLPTSYIIFLVCALLLVFVLLVLLWLEVRPHASNRVLIRGRDGTQTSVNTASVAESLRHHIDDIPDVFNVKPSVQGRRNGVDVLLNLETTPEIDIPAKMQEVSQAARDLIEGKMGLKLAGVKVQVKQAAYGSAKAPLPGPAAAPSAPPSSPTTPDALADNAVSDSDIDKVP